jgi:hypothetical protein
MSLLFIFARRFLLPMDRQYRLEYVNRHVDPTSDLRHLDEEKLERWERLRLLVPPNGQYRRTDLERTLALLILERALATKLETVSK